MRSKWTWTLIGIMLAAIGATMLLSGWKGEASPKPAQITIRITQSQFVPAEIRVKQGDQVSLLVKNEAKQTHNFIIPEYHIFSANLKPGETTTIQFEAVNGGKFPYFSDTPGFHEPGYHGEFEVESP